MGKNTRMEEVSRSIEELQRTIGELLQKRDQMLIHLHQYQLDYRKIQEMYGKFRQMVISDGFLLNNEKMKEYLGDKNGDIANIRSQIHSLSQKEVQLQNVQKATVVLDNTIIDNDFQEEGNRIKWSLEAAEGRDVQIAMNMFLSIGSIATAIQYDPSGRYVAYADNYIVKVIDSATGELCYSVEHPKSEGLCDIHPRVLKFSPDGKLIAVSTCGTEIMVVSTEDESIVGTLQGHKQAVSDLAFLHDGSTLVSGGYDGYVFIWDYNTMKCKKSIDPRKAITLAIGADNVNPIVSITVTDGDEFIAVGFLNGYVGLFESSFTKKMKYFAAHDEFIVSLASSAEKGVICTLSHDLTVKLWLLYETESPLYILKGHTNVVICADFNNSKTPQLLLTGSKDETIRGWDYSTGERIFTINTRINTIFSISHHPYSNSFVSISGDGVLCFWDYSIK